MVTIGGQPLLWHIMQFYSSYGYHRFILCLGLKSEVVKSYFLNYQIFKSSFSITFDADGAHPSPVVEAVPTLPPWTVSCIETGEDAMTGARIKRIQRLIGDQRFLLTYGDGLSNVDLDALVAFHESHGALATVTGVHPPSRFGLLTLAANQVVRFAEKPQTQTDFVNGGFFVLEPGVFDYLDDDDSCVFEQGPLTKLAEIGQLRAYLHNDYWQCMDTMRDRELLEEAWAVGPPWKRW